MGKLNAMKNFSFRIAKPAIAVLLAATAVSCSDFLTPSSRKTGGMEISFIRDLTKASALPDTNSFILTVQDGRGSILYNGLYGDAPQTILTGPGSFTVSAVSREFCEPLFDAAQFGDTQVVKVEDGKISSVKLSCIQTNAGVKLNVSPDFIAEYPDSRLSLKSASGKLDYGYSERRIAYFPPGNVCLAMTENGSEKTLFTRKLSSQQILVLNVNTSSETSPSPSVPAGISISVDTARNWTYEDFVIGRGSEGDSPENAYSVPEAGSHVGEKDVWVYGYIVGGDLSSSKCSFTPPFSSRTNIAIAAKTSCKDKSACLSVQLQKGDFRDELNLVDHENNIGRQVFLKGDIVAAYFGITGIQNISEVSLK